MAMAGRKALGWIGLVAAAAAAAGAARAGDAPLDLSKAAAVVLLREERVTVGEDGLKQTRTLRRVKILEADAVDYIGDVLVPYNAHYEKARLVRAETTTPDGRTVPVQADLVVDMLPRDQGGFREYSDNRHLAFSMPALCKGAVFEYEAEITQTAPVISNAFWHAFEFQEFFVPVQTARVSVCAPPHRPFQHRTTPAGMAVSAVTNGSGVTCTWVATNLPAVEFEPGMPTRRELLSSVRMSSLTNWTAVIDWYRKLIEGRGTCDEAMAARAARAAGAASTPLARAVALADLVQREVRYVAIELGEGAYQPRPAAQCFANLYGDCKDKAILLAALLREAGVEAELALVSATSGGVFDRDLPSPEIFNHVVVYAPGLDLWIDATAPYLGAFVHPEVLDGVEALVVAAAPGEGSGFRRIPCAPAELDTEETRLDITVQPDGLHHVRRSIRGHGRAAARLRERFVSMTPAEQQKAVTEMAEGEEGYRRLREWRMEGADGTTNVFSLTMDMDLEGLMSPTALGFSSEIDGANFCAGIRLCEPADRKRGRQYDWVCRSHARETLDCAVRIPPGYRVGGRLDAGSWSLVNGAVRFACTSGADCVSARLEVEAAPARIARGGYERTRLDIDRQISRIKRSVQLVDRVTEHRSQLQPEAARALLDELIAAHPDDAFLLARKGNLLNACGYLHGARQAYEAALEKDPSRANFYIQYAGTYAGYAGVSGDGYDRAAVLRVLSRGKGKVSDPAGLEVAIVEAYATDDRGRSPSTGSELAKALERAQAATEAYPRDPRPWLWYGDCLLYGKEYHASHEVFSRVIELDPRNLGGHIGQWRAAAMDGDVEAFIRAMRSVYTEEQAQFSECMFVAQLLAWNHRLEDARYVVTAASDAVGNAPLARAAEREIADLTDENVRDYRAFFDLSTPRQAGLTFMSAFLFTDEEKFARMLSRLVRLPKGPFMALMDDGWLRLMSDEAKNLGLASLMVDRNVKEEKLGEGLALVKMKRAAGRGTAANSFVGVLCREEDGEWRVVDLLFPFGVASTLGLALESAVKSEDAALRDALVSYYTRNGQAMGRMEEEAECPFVSHPFADAANQAQAIASYLLASLPDRDCARRATGYLEALAKAEPENRAIWRALAGGRLRLQELSGAAEAMAKAVELDPDDSRLQLEQLGTLLVCGRIEDAERCLAAADSKLGTLPALRELRKQFLLQAGRLPEALALVRAGARGSHALPGRMEQDLYVAMGLTNEIAKIEEQLDAERFDPMAHLNLARTYAALGRLPQVRQHVETLLLQERTSLPALRELCRCAILEGDPAEAECLVEQINALGKHHPELDEFLAPVYAGLGRYEDAARAFCERRVTREEDYFSRLLAACCHIMAGERKTATRQLEEVAGSYNPDHNAHLYAQLLLGKKDPDELLAEVQKVPDYTRRQDRLCEFYFYQGMLARMKGDRQAAAQAFAASRDTRASRNTEHFLSQVALRQLRDR